MNKYEVIFESENIVFVKLSIDLMEDYLIMKNDSEVANKLSHIPQKITYEEYKKRVEDKLKKGTISFSMIDKNTGEFIGNIEIMSIKDNIGEIGITITPNKQNKHYGRESLKAIMEYGYQNLDLTGYELNVFSTNKRAIKCYKNVGFIVDGIGKSEDDIHMKISR